MDTEVKEHEAVRRYGLRWARILICLRSPEASLLQDEERLWMELIAKDDGSKAPQRADIVEKSYGDQASARSRQEKMGAALVDYK